jgi:SSS family solute:Na+ symporter
MMGKAPEQDSSVSLDEVSFDTDKPFNIAGVGVVVILVALYATWW